MRSPLPTLSERTACGFAQRQRAGGLHVLRDGGDVDDDGQPTNRIAPREGDEDDGFDVNDDPGEENWDDDGNNLAGGNDHDGD